MAHNQHKIGVQVFLTIALCTAAPATFTLFAQEPLPLPRTARSAFSAEGVSEIASVQASETTPTTSRSDVVVTRAKLQRKVSQLIEQVAGNTLTDTTKVTTIAPSQPAPPTSLSVLAPAVPPLPPATPRVLPALDVCVASFLGVMPGVTTLQQVVELWGEPQRVSELAGKTAHLYSTEELSHIEVVFDADKVASILVKLDSPLSESQVTESLQDELKRVEPVMLPDGDGKIVGVIFPERGVFFLFAARSSGNAERLVTHIGIEPIAADSFTLRGEAAFDERPSEALRDLVHAAKLAPNDAKVNWLLSRLLLLRGDIPAALASCEKAIALDESRPLYHLTLAQILIQLNRADEARVYLESTIPIAAAFPHEKAQILVTLGDLYRTAITPQYEKAIELHSEAIRLASKAIDSPQKTVRAQAQEVLFQSHLSAARDVAWGDWNDKDESIKRWIAGAAKFVSEDDGTVPIAVVEDRLFQLAVCSLATQIGLPESTAIEQRIEDVVTIGNDVIANTSDPLRQQKYWREIGLALYDAVQIFQIRKTFPLALQYGEQAARYLSRGLEDRRSETDVYLLGRLYFRLGAIHAIGMKQHRAAIVWFDKAIPMLEPLIPTIAPEELGRFGETFVSMGVSFWEVNQYDRAIALTEAGLRQMERGVQTGTVPPAALHVPYTNLATMYTKLENTEDAQRCLRLAESIKQGARPTALR
ncbi:MAG: tetratricopeptide repeat protein [Thermoguttaceae bacterium]